jgi:hypothetical protein
VHQRTALQPNARAQLLCVVIQRLAVAALDDEALGVGGDAGRGLDLGLEIAHGLVQT